eukprot:7673264-Pyramimonas_sp.AAC.1
MTLAAAATMLITMVGGRGMMRMTTARPVTALMLVVTMAIIWACVGDSDWVMMAVVAALHDGDVGGDTVAVMRVMVRKR